MARFSLKGVAGVGLLAWTAACASGPTALVTKSPELVANCEKVGEVASDPFRPGDVQALARDATAKGANYVLVGSDEARSGVAYRCAMPSATGGGH